MSQQERTRIDPETKLTPFELKLLGLIAVHTIKHGSLCASKPDIARHLECCIRTADRSTRRLRDEGYITVTPKHGPNGGQAANEYRLAIRK